MSHLNYTTYVSEIANLLVIGTTDANYQTMIPGMIDYAEGRIYRELDLLATQVSDATTTASSGNRNFTLPTSVGTFIAVDNVNVITPSTMTSSNGTRNQLVPTSLDFLDIAYPSGHYACGVPKFWAMYDDGAIVFGPAPDKSYTIEVYGIQRPTALSTSNSSTILTQYIPDVFTAASMVYASAYQRDFSLTGDNPQQGATWENQYKMLSQSAAVEQLRAKQKMPPTAAAPRA
jgi:hypothetical protein